MTVRRRPSKSRRRRQPRWSSLEDLSSFENAVRVEGGFDGAHDVDAGAVLRAQRVDLAQADAVFSGARTAHGQGALDESLIELFGRSDFFGLLLVEDEQHVKVAVADVS